MEIRCQNDCQFAEIDSEMESRLHKGVTSWLNFNHFRGSFLCVLLLVFRIVQVKSNSPSKRWKKRSNEVRIWVSWLWIWIVNWNLNTGHRSSQFVFFFGECNTIARNMILSMFFENLFVFRRLNLCRFFFPKFNREMRLDFRQTNMLASATGESAISQTYIYRFFVFLKLSVFSKIFTWNSFVSAMNYFVVRTMSIYPPWCVLL